jgi:hypothetical protein
MADYADAKRALELLHHELMHLNPSAARSAAEMMVAFASRSKIAAVVGAPTPGQVLGAANFKVGGDYRLRIPLTAWYMWDGELIVAVRASAELTEAREG